MAKDPEQDVIQSPLTRATSWFGKGMKTVRGWFTPKSDDSAIAALEMKEKMLTIMSSITREELEGSRWDKDDAQQKCPNVMALIDVTNRMSAQVRDDILLCSSAKEQKQKYKYYARMMQEASKIGDYQTANAIYNTIGVNVDITRLQDFLGDSETRRIIAAHDELFNTSNDQANLKAAIKNSSTKQATVPLFSMILKRLLTADGIPIPDVPGPERDQKLADVKARKDSAIQDFSSCFKDKPREVPKKPSQLGQWPGSRQMNPKQAQAVSEKIKVGRGKNATYWQDIEGIKAEVAKMISLLKQTSPQRPSTNVVIEGAKQDEVVVAQPVIAQETQVQAPGPIANAKDLVELEDMTATNDLAELENDLAELDAISARTFAEMEKIAKELEQIAKVEQASATVEPVQAEISTEEEEAKKLATRRRYILQEVNSTEDTYLREMKVVLDKKDVLLNQIKNDKKFSKEEKQTIGELIQTLEHIYKVQSEMRNEFVALAKALEEGDSVKAAASSKTIAGLTKLSAQYHGQYAAVYDGKFSSMLNKDKLNKSFVKLSEVLGGWKLDSKLITPVQRYPRYELLFKELEKSTEPSFSLYSMFQNLSTLFKAASDTVNNIPKFRAFNAIMKAEKLKGKEIEAYSKLVEDFEKNPNDANLKAQIAAWDKKHPRIGEASALYAEILPLMHKPTVTDKGREIPKQQPLPDKAPTVLYQKPPVRSPEEKAQAEKIVQARLSTLESIFDQLKDNASEDGKWKLRLLHEYLVKNLKDNTLSATVDRLKGELPSYVRSIKGSDELDQFLDSLSKELKDPLKVDLKPKEVVIDKEAQAARDRVIADLLGTFTYANTKQDEDMILKPLKKYVNEALKNNITPQGVRNLWKQMPSHVQGSQEIKAKFDGLVANYEMVLADMKTGVELSDKQKKRP